MEEKQEMSFETAIARLEEIVRMLESGNAPLDKALAAFEEGVSLVKLCNSRLDTAEQRRIWKKTKTADYFGEYDGKQSHNSCRKRPS